MDSGVIVALTVVAAIGSGIVGGAFFAFSTFVMRGLEHLGPGGRVAAMQGINEHAPTGGFLVVLLGTALASVALAVVAVVHWDDPGARAALGGGVLHLAGLVTTTTYHVPRNDALATVDPDGPDAAAAWSSYAPGWTRWNHARAVACTAAAAVLVLAARAY